MKICKVCQKEKELSEYYTNKNNKDGYLNKCKSCQSEECIAKYKENPEKFKRKSKKYREENIEVVKSSVQHYYQTNKENIDLYRKEWRDNNKDYIKVYNKQYGEDNKEELAVKRVDYLLKNRSKFKEYFYNYNKNNSERRLEQRITRKYITKKYNYLYKKHRYATDPMYKLHSNLSRTIHNAFRRFGFKKNSRTHEILGCTFEFFKIYIESKFELCMSWENKGLYNGELNFGWDLDHIIPISSAKTEEDVLRLNHYTNFQPLCSYYNRYIKRDNIN